MRRCLAQPFRHKQEILEMLKITCAAPLGDSVPPRPNKSQRGAGTSRSSSSSSKQPNRQDGTLNSPSSGKYGASKPSRLSGPGQQQEYHNISSNWNVPRTPLTHFPEDTQRVIREGKGRKSFAKEPLLSEFQPIVDKILTVLAYETNQGLINFTGNNGETFTEWMQRNLLEFGESLKQKGHESLRDKYKELVQRLESYSSMQSGSAQRSAVLHYLTTEVTSIGHDLQAHPHRQRTGRYDHSMDTPNAPQQQEDESKNTNAEAMASPSRVADGVLLNSTNENITNNDEAAAAEAHAEETAGSIDPSSGTTAESLLIPTTTMLYSGKPVEAADEEGYVMVGNRKIKASTVAFRQAFAEAAALQQAASNSKISDIAAEGEQRTSQWMALRERRLTASAFSKALGFFPGDRASLWEEKVGLRAPFAGNEATSWGTKMEPYALSNYEALTGQTVESCMFRVKHDDPPHGWLGASPDGLVQGLGISGGSGGARAAAFMPSAASPLGPGPGILEIKCPFNKGRPELAQPPQKAIWYYMPQLQGLMDIFDRQWCSLYVWTKSHGSAAFRIERDMEYWAAAYEVLAEFWWAHVVPARQANDAGASREEIEAFRPSEQHPAAERLKEWSKRLAEEAPRTYYPPSGLGIGVTPPTQQPSSGRRRS